jgi:hypothetical protein
MRPDLESRVTQTESPKFLESPKVIELNTAARSAVDEATPHAPLEPQTANELPAAIGSESELITVSDLAADSPEPVATLAMAPVGLAPPQPEKPRTPVATVRTISVNLNADPWAYVELDGRSIGSTPLADVPISLGPHRVVLRFPDGLVLERTVKIDAFSRYLRFP